MAPEYLVKGQLTEKADIYSFGVLVLEIVCGRRNNVFVEDSGSLVQSVINHLIPTSNGFCHFLHNDKPVLISGMEALQGKKTGRSSRSLFSE